MKHPPEKCAKCGQRLRQRSDEEHNHYFAVLRSVYDNWPYSDKFHPESEEHLRHYLQMHAGHYRPVDVSAVGVSPDVIADQVTALIQSLGVAHPFIEHRGECIRIYVPLSVNKTDCKVKVFREVKAKVFDIIKARTGIDCETVTGQEAA
jgi:hypothetical protein